MLLNRSRWVSVLYFFSSLGSKISKIYLFFIIFKVKTFLLILKKLFKKMLKFLLYSIFIFSIYCSSSPLRATWVTTYDPIQTQWQCETLLSSLKLFGITKVYVSIWQAGNLFAQSQTYSSLMGFSKPDYLSNMINAADKIGGVSIVAWFEYGNMAQYGGVSTPFALKAKSLGWLLENGKLVHGYSWMDPSNSNFVEFFVKMVSEVNNNYRKSCFKGVQLDDHTGWPYEFYGVSSDEKRRAVSNIIQLISSQIGANRLSISPNVMPQSYDNFNADWPTWRKNYWVYEIIPQTYYDNLNSFQITLQRQLNYADSSVLVAGIRCNGSPSPSSWDAVKSMIDYANSKNLKGVCIWYARCLYQDYKDFFGYHWRNY